MVSSYFMISIILTSKIYCNFMEWVTFVNNSWLNWYDRCSEKIIHKNLNSLYNTNLLVIANLLFLNYEDKSSARHLVKCPNRYSQYTSHNDLCQYLSEFSQVLFEVVGDWWGSLFRYAISSGKFIIKINLWAGISYNYQSC